MCAWLNLVTKQAALEYTVKYFLPFLLSGARALLDISSRPTLRDVDEHIVTSVAAHWKRLALKLGLEFCVIEIISKNHSNDCEGACQDMFKRWLGEDRHTGVVERTWSTILTTLGRAGHAELERSLRNERFNAD